MLQQLAIDQKSLDSDRRTSLNRGRAEYIAQIQATVNRSWILPPGVPKGLKSTVLVGQIPGGEVISVVIKESSGNVVFDRSVVQAVYRSSPLPQPKVPGVFDREIQFTFDPED